MLGFLFCLSKLFFNKLNVFIRVEIIQFNDIIDIKKLACNNIKLNRKVNESKHTIFGHLSDNLIHDVIALNHF